MNDSVVLVSESSSSIVKWMSCRLVAAIVVERMDDLSFMIGLDLS